MATPSHDSSPRGLCPCLRGGSELFEREASLIAQGREIKVYALAGHPAGAEARNIHELQRERTPTRRYAQELSFACPSQRSPRHDHVIAEGEALIVRRQIGKGGKVSLIGGPSGGAALDAQI